MISKNIFICFVLWVLIVAPLHGQQEGVSYSVLSIEYVGPHDKPVTPIVISDSKTGAEWYRDQVLKGDQLKLISIHVVDSSLLSTMIKDAEEYRRIAQKGPANQSRSSGTVSITVNKAGGRSTFLLSTKSALSLIEILEKESKDRKSLAKDLAHFDDRLISLKD